MKKNLKALTILLRASKSVEKVLKQDIASYNLNPSEFGVLEYLYHKGNQPMANLCKRLLMANSSMTYVVDNLVLAGYVEKIENNLDKRSNFVKLTKKGEDFIKSIFPSHEEKIDEIFSLLTTEEVDTLAKSLKKIGIYSEQLDSSK
ncbi:MAG: MarR family winged helix-turn-helix transcriptional regulator [Bacilli bacterium]